MSDRRLAHLPADFDITKPWIGMVLISSVLPNPEQPRTDFDLEELRRTAESLEDDQIQPVSVIPHRDPNRPEIVWMIVDGERRWRGLQLVGKTLILVFYKPGITLENIHSKSFAANFCRLGHNHMDTARAIAREYNDGKGKSFAEIAKMVGKTTPWVYNEYALLKLVPELQVLVDSKDKNKRIATKVALLLADMPKERQLPVWLSVCKHKASAQFTKLRFSKDVRLAADSRRNDDRYCLRIGEALQRSAFALADVPRVMIKNLKPGSIDELRRQLRETDKHIAKIRERLMNAESGGES